MNALVYLGPGRKQIEDWTKPSSSSTTTRS